MQVQYLWVNLLDKCEHDNVEIAHSPIWLFYTYLTLIHGQWFVWSFFFVCSTSIQVKRFHKCQ